MSASLYIVRLPEHKWHKCDFCEGTGSIEMSENLHESAGIVPCGRCDRDGIVRHETITLDERNRREAAQRKAWAKPSYTETK